MSTERNKQVVRRLYDVVNSGDIETLNELAVLDYDEHDPLPGQATGRQGLADRVTILRTAFAPQFTIEDVIAEHDKVVRVAARRVATGFTAPVSPPTGDEC